MSFVPSHDPFAGMKRGGKWGAIIGGGLGFLGAGIFGAIPGALLGASTGASFGGMRDMFQMNYGQMQQAYDPRMLGYPHVATQTYGGYAMPNGLFGQSQARTYPRSYGDYQQQVYDQTRGSAHPYPYSPVVMQEQPRSGLGPFLAGTALGAFGMPLFGWGMGFPFMMGMGGLGLGGFNWWAF